ncbi:MAG: carboxypeptidase-like regulatory domain-containing protein [Bacteroidota bacterium]
MLKQIVILWCCGLLVLSCKKEESNPIPAIKLGSISGTITDSISGALLTNAQIFTNPPTKTAASDSTGKYLIDNLTDGDYTVYAAKGGYNGSNGFPVTISNGNTATANIALSHVHFLYINSMVCNPPSIAEDSTASVTVYVIDPGYFPVTYDYSASGGTIIGSGSVVNYKAPSVAGVFTINVTVTDIKNWKVSDSLSVHVYPAGTLFNDQFDSFTGWTYTQGSDTNASFGVNQGAVFAINFGSPDTTYYGPRASKPLSAPIDLRYEDFTLNAYLISTDALLKGMSAGGNILVYIADDNNFPIAGLEWRKVCGVTNCTFNLQMFTQGAVQNAGIFNTISGKVTLKKVANVYSLHYNDGLTLTSAALITDRVPTKVLLEILIGPNENSRAMSVDYITVTRP